MNKVIIMGRLTRDPEVRYSQGADPMAIARYTLAVDRRGRNNDGEQTADFISCVAFARAGEFAEKYLKQGMRMLITGRIQTGSYTNKDGQKVYTTDVVVEDQEFADSKGQGNDNGAYQVHGSQPSNSTFPGMQRGYNTQPVRNNTFVGDGFMSIPDGVEDEGLPFR